MIDTIRSSAVLLLTCTSILVPVMAEAAPAVPDGVYKKLKYAEESGDLLGMAVEIHRTSQPTITVTTCEGGCHGGKSWPLVIKGQSIGFTVCDDLVDQDGHPAKCVPNRYAGQFRPDGTLVVFMPGVPDTRYVLRKVIHPKKDEVRALACMGGC